ETVGFRSGRLWRHQRVVKKGPAGLGRRARLIGTALNSTKCGPVRIPHRRRPGCGQPPTVDVAGLSVYLPDIRAGSPEYQDTMSPGGAAEPQLRGRRPLPGPGRDSGHGCEATRHMCDEHVLTEAAGEQRVGRTLTVARARQLNSRTYFYEMLKDNPR